jgi:hypothetical protein
MTFFFLGQLGGALKKNSHQNLGSLVDIVDNLDNIRPYQQRGRWNINPAKFNSSIQLAKSNTALV